MKQLKSFLILYILISQILLANTNEIIKNTFYFYPYPNDLEQYLKEYFKEVGLSYDDFISKISKADPIEIKNIVNTVISIVNFSGFLKGGASIISPKMYISFTEKVSLYGGLFLENVSILCNLLANNPLITGGAIALLCGCVGCGIYLKKIIDEDNLKTISQIKELLAQPKYQDIIENLLKPDLEILINEAISQKFDENYKTNFLTKDNITKLESIFSERVESLNFILLGKPSFGKNTLISEILNLTHGVNGALENVKMTKSTEFNFTKLNNKEKKGINLINSTREDNSKSFNIRDSLEEFNNYFYKEIMTKNKNFIYGIFYFLDEKSNLVGEYEPLKNLIKYYYNKIPLELVYTENYTEHEKNQLNDNTFSKIGIKPFFFNSQSEHDHKKDLKAFLIELLNKFDEDKLEDIYRYYYSLNFFDIFMNQILYSNALINIFAQFDPIKNVNSVKYLLARLKLDINSLLKRPNINYEKITKKLQEINSKVLEQLEIDSCSLKE